MLDNILNDFEKINSDKVNKKLIIKGKSIILLWINIIDKKNMIVVKLIDFV